LAGSYNPPQLGHVQMLNYLSSRYKHVVAVVGCNPSKTYSVSPQTRAIMLRRIMENELSPCNNISVQVVSEYVWRYGKSHNVSCFVRGIRTWKQDGEEERFLHILNTYGPLLVGPLVWPIPTVFLEGDPRYNHVSSTLIRDVCSCSDDNAVISDANRNQDEATVTSSSLKRKEELISQLVPASIASQVIQIYSR